jgi:hypothetical protein
MIVSIPNIIKSLVKTIETKVEASKCRYTKNAENSIIIQNNGLVYHHVFSELSLYI